MNTPALPSSIIIVILFSCNFFLFAQDVSLQVQVGGSEEVSYGIGNCFLSSHYEVFDNLPPEVNYLDDQLFVDESMFVTANFTITVPLTTSPGVFHGNIIYEVFDIDDILCIADTIEVEVEVIPAQAPVPDFSATPETTIEGGSVQFTNLTENTVTDWLWEFGDGATSMLENPAHIYQAPGFYTVSLSATGPAESAVATKTDFIQVFEAQTPGQQFWAFETEGAIISSPAIGTDGTIYIGSHNGYLHALNPDGTEKWAFDTDGYAFTPVLGNSGTIYVVSNLFEMLAINPNGTMKWIYEAPFNGGYINFVFALDMDETIYFGTSEGKLHKLDSLGNELWKVQLGESNTGANYPTIGTDGTIYVASGLNATHNMLYAIHQDGTKKWATEYVDGVGLEKNKISITKSGDIYLTNGHRVAAFNQTGELLWYFPEENQSFNITSEVVYDENGNLYVGGFPGENTSKLYCLNANGQLNWEIDVSSFIPTSGASNEMSTPVIGNDGNIYFYTKGGVAFAVNNSGILLWQLAVVSEDFQPNTFIFDDAPAMGIDGTLYFGDDNGVVHAISTGSNGKLDGKWSKQGQNNFNTRNYKCPSPDLNSPADSTESVSTSPILSWDSVLGAVAYEVQLTNIEDFTSPITQMVSGNQALYTGIEQSEYYWRVRPVYENDEPGCWSTAWVFSTDTFNSSEWIPSKDEVNIYPNPVKHFLVIEIESPISTAIELVLYNSMGNPFLSQKKTIHSGKNTFELNTNDLPPGTYYYQIIGDNDLKSVGAFVLAR
jgi:outer membrane protein assembly factor BamB